MKALTPEQINEGFAKPIATVLAFVFAQIKSEDAKAKIAEIKEAVNTAIDAIDLANPPSVDALVESVLKIAETSAELTPTEVDDKIVDAAEIVYQVIDGKGGLLTGIIALAKARAAIKKAK